MTRHLLSIADFDRNGVDRIIGAAATLKAERAAGLLRPLLKDASLAMIFEKSSTRTRVSFEVGMTDLAGHALFLNASDLQLGRGEEIRDTARVLSRYVSAVMIRAYRHDTIQEFAANSTIPVINGLSDREHPCQVLADILTIRERYGTTEGIRMAWIGDGNNVCNSLILATALTGIDLVVASPPRYRPPESIVARARELGGRVEVTGDPRTAARDADVLYTDTWISMGEEAEQDVRRRILSGYTIDSSLLGEADSEAIVMHCLPAHRGEEITDAVMEGAQSAIWDQAENRLHVQKALLVELITGSPA
ncbi:MAG: ornithine carbamoyltransferase [Methanomicrobiales archaeon]